MRQTFAVRILDSLAMVGSGAYGVSHELDCNVYVVWSDGEAAVFDAGCGLNTSSILSNLQQLGINRTKYIFVTHCHADHACGCVELQSSTGGVVAASGEDATMMEKGSDYDLGLDQARLSGSYPFGYEYVHSSPEIRVKDAAEFEVGRLHVTAAVIPSHTPGSTVYLIEGNGRRDLMSGDVLMVGGLVSLINVPGCELQNFRSYLPRLAGLKVDGLFPGHWMWCVRNGQKHIDDVVRQLKTSRLPRNFASLLG